MNNYFGNIYAGKRVLVTGNTGFKGSWLSLWLHLLGSEVMGIALQAKHERDHFRAAKLSEYMECRYIDIRDYSQIRDIIKAFNPDIIFHLAAQSLVGVAFDNPKYTLETNMIGTLNVLETMRSTRSESVAVFITSDKCYRNTEQMWGYRENDILGGNDPYSSSKAGAELIINSYIKSYPEEFGSTIASTRAGNVIGGGDWSELRLVPDCFRTLMEKRPIVLRNSKSTRPWQYVLEPLSGYLLLGEKLLKGLGDYSTGWNFGPPLEETHTVLKVAEAIIRYWGEGVIQINDEQNKFHESTLLKLDCTKARTLLDWIPTLGFEECIKFTTEWYKYSFKNDNTDVYSFSIDQIKQYQSRAIEKKCSWTF